MNWLPKGNFVFVSADGDDIGSQVSASILSGDESKAHKLSLLINVGGKAIMSFTKKVWGAKSIIAGGDDIMVKVAASRFILEDVEIMRAVYAKTVKGATLSVGIGSTPEEAMKSLVIAKNTGKNKSVFWEDSLQPTYKKVIVARINDLREKVRAQAGITEAIGDIHKLAPAAVRRTIRRREKEANITPAKDRFHRAKNRDQPKRRDLASSGAPSAVADRQKHVNLMRDLVVHHKRRIEKYKEYTARNMDAGNTKTAWEFRRMARMEGHRLYHSKAVAKTAETLRNTKDLPSSIRRITQRVRDSKARDIKAARNKAKSPVSTPADVVKQTAKTKPTPKKSTAAPAPAVSVKPTSKTKPRPASFAARAVKTAVSNAKMRVDRAKHQVKAAFTPSSRTGKATSTDPWLKNRHKAGFHAHLKFISALRKVQAGKSLIPSLEIQHPKPKSSTAPASGKPRPVPKPAEKKHGKTLPGGGYLVLKPRHLHAYLKQHHRPW